MTASSLAASVKLQIHQCPRETPIAAIGLPDVDLMPFSLSTVAPTFMATPALGFLSVDPSGQRPITTSGSFLSYVANLPEPQFAQMSGAILPGNEGGPLLEVEGKVLGIVVNKRDLSKSQGGLVSTMITLSP